MLQMQSVFLQPICLAMKTMTMIVNLQYCETRMTVRLEDSSQMMYTVEYDVQSQLHNIKQVDRT